MSSLLNLTEQNNWHPIKDVKIFEVRILYFVSVSSLTRSLALHSVVGCLMAIFYLVLFKIHYLIRNWLQTAEQTFRDQKLRMENAVFHIGNMHAWFKVYWLNFITFIRKMLFWKVSKTVLSILTLMLKTILNIKVNDIQMIFFIRRHLYWLKTIL